MNLKLKLVAAMCVLGWMSCPVFADDAATGSTTTANTATANTATANTTPEASGPPTITKTKHHSHHHGVRHSAVSKDREEVPVEPAPVDVCSLSQSDMVLDMMTQNGGRALPNPCNPGWFNRIQWSGGVNVDMGKWGNRNANLMGENYHVVALNDAYLNLSALVGDWTTVFASLSYNTATLNDPEEATGVRHVSEYAAAYNGIPLGTTYGHTLQLEQAYFTVGNFDLYPIFLQVGEQFQDFGRYEIHAITRSLTQSMSETLATSAKLGFISELGFNGSISVFTDPLRKRFANRYTTNYDLAVGFQQTICDWGWDLGAAYLYNMVGVNDIAFNAAQFNFLAGNGFEYTDRAGGVAVYGDFNYGPFLLNARWTTAVQRFNPMDVPRHGIADTTVIILPDACPTCGTKVAVVNPTAAGAKPWAASVQAAYGFDGICDMTQTVYVGYQTSREAAGLQLPHHRYVAGVSIDPWNNTEITLEWDHDNAYDVALGGSGRSTNLVTLRAAARFG